MPSAIENDQADFVARLEDDAYFVDIGVYELRPRANLTATQIVGNIERALNNLVKKGGKAGAAVTVLMPTMNVPEANTTGPNCEERITVRVQESPLVNMNPATGTGKSAEDIALYVLQMFHLWASGTGTWVADTDALTPSVEFDPKVTYDVSFRRLVKLQTRAKAAQPLITPDTGTTPRVVTIAAAAGAAIYYTLDGTLPTAATGTLYTAPITVEDAATLRAVAIETGKAASNVAWAKYADAAGDFSSDFAPDFAGQG